MPMKSSRFRAGSVIVDFLLDLKISVAKEDDVSLLLTINVKCLEIGKALQFYQN